MRMYKLIEYSDSFSMTSESWWNYYRNELNNSANETDNNDNMINNNKTKANKPFKYKTKEHKIIIVDWTQKLLFH